jgi:argininosuccinate synthase
VAHVGHEGPQRLIDYAAKHAIPVTATKEKPYSTDRNLFHISYEGGVLEDPWAEPPSESMFLLTTAPEKAPDAPEYVEVEFERGRARGRGRPALGAVALLERSTRSAASTASAASTSSRTATWA